MDKLSKEEVLHVAKLARLELSDEEIEKYRKDLKDLFAMADVVISRAGANVICELLALRKPSLLIPLPASSSRGDQILNAKSFEAQGFSMVADEDELTPFTLVEKVHELYFNRQSYMEAMQNCNQRNSIQIIMDLITEVTK